MRRNRDGTWTVWTWRDWVMMALVAPVLMPAVIAAWWGFKLRDRARRQAAAER